MSRARNPYRRAGSWVVGTGWTTAPPEPVDGQDDVAITVPAVAADGLRWGWTMADLASLARLAVDRCRTSTARSETERYDLAWSAIAESLYAATEPPEQADLIAAGQRAIWDEIDAGLRHDGYYLHLAEHGPGSSSNFRKYWSMHSGVVPSPEARIVERVALHQILPLLSPQQRDLIVALAALGDYRSAAQAVGTTRTHMSAVLSEGRARFRRWWHQGEEPSRHWRHDVRATCTGTGERAKSDIREQLKQRRCKQRAKLIAAGVIQPRVKPDPLTPIQVAEIAAEYRSGMTLAVLAERHDTSVWRIRHALDQAQVQPRPRGVPRRRGRTP